MLGIYLFREYTENKNENCIVKNKNDGWVGG